MQSSRSSWVVACIAGIVLAGCDDGPPAGAPDPAVASPKTSKPPASHVPPDMVSAVSSTKNASVVGVHFVLKGIPTVSKALPVEVAIVPHEPMSAVVAHFEARDGLAVATGNALERQPDPVPDKVIRHQLILLPGKEGVFVVTAIIETETLEGAVSRIYSIPVIVGPSGAAPAETPVPPPPAPPASG